ncbi:translation elongation factor Ts [Mycoplasma haemocanis str. Illinois]|uniref:Elongation factor Ts n=1 Tax=Mycoplasma haemocanis (strain Illinois) TaxID=1111676 RepID=H6N8J0_MYCHN|nr:translation elongation factor Ts [Mycoplasma haemocanis]AEW45962.1 translation elongation factor Ts [Mycoplasma haemocanis str. Illinois]
MAIDKDLILKLRNASQAGLADCKKALEENNNDLEASIKWLRTKGIAKATNKNALREAKEGSTFVKKDSKGVVIMEMNSETDFVANSKEFTALADRIMDSILNLGKEDLEEINSLKMETGESVADGCLHLSSITGEKIVLSRARYFALGTGESVACYRHNNGRMSAFVILSKALKDEDIYGLAVHYAANNPKFISPDQVDESWINSEKEIITTLLEKENKPKEFHANIIEQRIKKLVAQEAFVEQPYLYDTSKKIKDRLRELDVEVRMAMYFGLGESK